MKIIQAILLITFVLFESFVVLTFATQPKFGSGIFRWPFMFMVLMVALYGLPVVSLCLLKWNPKLAILGLLTFGAVFLFN